MGMGSSNKRCKFWLWVLPILFVATFATSASAQGLFGLGLPSFNPFSAEPYSCAPNKSVCGPLTFYVGWADDRKGTTLSADLRRQNLGPFGDDLGSIRNSYGLRGVWLGVAAQPNLIDRVGLLADFWILIPSNRSSDENFSVTEGFSGGKTWGTNTDWWFVDGALSYDICGLGKLIGGFRYDRFATNFKDPGNFSGALGTPSDTGDVTINCYIPFVGLQADLGSPGVNELMFRVIGFPWVGGDVKYHDSIGNFAVLEQDRIELSQGVNKGYFLEAFAEYGRTVYGSGRIGVFGRWNIIHGNAKRIDISDVLAGIPAVGGYQFAFDRQSWTFGGSFSLAFTTPW